LRIKSDTANNTPNAPSKLVTKPIHPIHHNYMKYRRQ
jgi:hypothetical protein